MVRLAATCRDYADRVAQQESTTMQTDNIRILLAKVGLDGHDRGVKVLARSFREAGFEVIYTGLWQTCEATMHAAMQEDVDVVGVSLLSAAHKTVIPELIAQRTQLGIESIPILLGGIIPQADHDEIRALGVAAIFNPGSSISDITQTIRDLVRRNGAPTVAQLTADYAAGLPRALAKLISHVQHKGDFGDWSPPTGHATLVGITGAPGVGKSSFIGKLGSELRDRGLRVGVIAVDPTSPVTGGALLGDRLRMMKGSPDSGFFVRSIASAKTPGGLAPHCRTVIKLLDGFGLDVVFVETVGAGQADVAIRELVDHVVLLVMPESGDTIQYSKAGIMEVATHFVINKCDLPGADATHAQMLSAIGDQRPIWPVSSVSSEGLASVADWLTSLRS